MAGKPPTIRVPYRNTLPLPCAGETIGPYEVMEEGLPEDGFYLFDVRHPQLDVRRRLKAVSERRSSPEFIRELSSRLRAVCALSSPFLYRPLETGFDEKHKLFYAVYENVAPKSLRDLDNYGMLTGEEALTVLLAASGGLAALEEAGLRHGRLTAEKIVFTEDFGQIELDGLDIAPEERNFALSTEALSGGGGDLFALGRIAYEMVTGRKPAPEEGSDGTDPRRWRPEFPGPLAVVIMRLLSREPVTAFQCAAELNSELKMLLSRLAPADVRALCQAPKRTMPKERIPLPPPPVERRKGDSAAPSAKPGRRLFHFGRSGLGIAVLILLLLFTVVIRLVERSASAPAGELPAFRLSAENSKLRTELDRLNAELERLTHLRNAWMMNRPKGEKLP